MKSQLGTLALAILVIAALACGSTPTPAPAQPTSAPPPLSSDATLTLNNNSGQTICYVYISPTTSDTWGDDWLGSSEVVDSGTSRTFSVPAGSYDLRADDCNNTEIDVQWDVNVSGSVPWDIGSSGGGGGGSGGGDATLTLNNNSGQTVCYVYISPTTSDTWGDDWLGSSEVIDSGTSRAFSVPSGSYDLRADDCNNTEIDVQWDVNVSGSVPWNIGSSGGGGGGSGGGDATLTLNNNSGQTICYVYISPTTSDTWGDDWLGGSEVVDDGTSRTFSVPSGSYDLRADDCSDTEIDVQWDINVSGSVSWDVGGGGSAGGGGGGAQYSVTLINNSDETICYVYYAPTGSSSWGDDWLGSSEVIESGTSREFFLETGTYDFLAEDCSHEQMDFQGSVVVDENLDWTINQREP